LYIKKTTVYASDAEMAMDYAAAVNQEIEDLFLAGPDVPNIVEHHPHQDSIPWN
jgi:methionine synthase II (cobalamin-independent)